MDSSTRLSVNLNKIAVLRNSRGGDEPSVLRAAGMVIAAGCDGITVHPRPDQRHIRADDVRALARLCAQHPRIELNIEGNPFAPARGGYPGLLALCGEVHPAQATLVPDGDGQLTSDHGFDLVREADRLAPLVAELKGHGCRVSLFVDAGCGNLEIARQMGADRIEIYTGPYAQAHAKGDASSSLAACRETARTAIGLGLGVNAGHDLSQSNLAAFLAGMPRVLEVSIGHALIGEALEHGLAETVRAYLALTRTKAPDERV